MRFMLKRWHETIALRVLLSVFTLTLAMSPSTIVAQNLGQTPATGQAVQGQPASA